MPRRTRKFIDKKRDPTYAVVRRSELDVGAAGTDGVADGDGTGAPSPFVLVPANRAAQDALGIVDTGGEWGRGTAGECDAADDDDGPEGDDFFATALSRGDHVDPTTGAPADADYDYSVHLRPIEGGGGAIFVGPGGKAGKPPAAKVGFLPASALPGADNTGDSRPAAIAAVSVVADRAVMDGDVAAALFDDAEEFEELLDDFCLVAGGDGPIEDLPEDYQGQEEPEDFDYEAHIRNLMAKSAAVASGGDAVLPDADQMAFWNNFRSRADDQDEDDEEFGEEYGEQNEVEDPGGDLSEKLFLQTLEEYDDDEIGALDGHFILPAGRDVDAGEVPVDGDGDGDDPDAYGPPQPDEGELLALEKLADAYAAELRDRALESGRTEDRLGPQRKAGGSGFNVTVAGRRMAADELNAEEDLEIDAPPLVEVLEEAAATMLEPKSRPGAFEDAPMDAVSYFAEKSLPAFDCQSVLSTYSNVENHPATIDAGSGIFPAAGRRKGKNRKDRLEQQRAPQNQGAVGGGGHFEKIHLSSKTGLPLGLDLGMNAARGGRPADDDAGVSLAGFSTTSTLGVARDKNESAEEKRARKQAAKMERQVSRLRKKMMRVAFAEEIGVGGAAAPVVGGDRSSGNAGVLRYA